MSDLVGHPEDRFSHVKAQMGQKQENPEIIRIYHEFVDRTDNFVPMVIVWHHEALPSDNKQ